MALKQVPIGIGAGVVVGSGIVGSLVATIPVILVDTDTAEGAALHSPGSEKHSRMHRRCCERTMTVTECFFSRSQYMWLLRGMPVHCMHLMAQVLADRPVCFLTRDA